MLILLKKLGTRLNQTGSNTQSWGLFLCSFCFEEVERPLRAGREAKSCGCMANELRAEASRNRIWTEVSRQKAARSKIGKYPTEEIRKKQSESHKGQNLSEIHKDGCGCAICKAKRGETFGENNPFYGKKHLKESRLKIGNKSKGRIHTEETREKIRLGNKGKIISEETKNKQSKAQSRENHWNWQNGKTFEEYPQEFFDIREYILERDNYVCQCPDCEHKTTKLDIHHIDFDKENNGLNNLIVLCDSCHARTYGKKKRKYFIEFYQNIMIKRNLIDII